ncbi:MAG TPA: NAD(P)H-binding protein [Pyrinomonadaceae bacterium]|nr:NAD(P)H-binding protein [Pyrinomonadaceae bacterium]
MSMRVLITGGNGSLGRDLVRAVACEGRRVRVMSRRPRAQSASSEVEWAQADIATGEGLRAAVADVDVVIHAASDPRRTDAVDVEGTRRLVDAARDARVAHLVFISIVGIDEIPFYYYKRKLAAERIIEASGLPYSTLRATQFHSLIEFSLSALARVPLVLPLPTDFKFQSVAQEEVAELLARCLDEGPRGRLPDFGGPEVLTLGEMAATWMEAKGVRKRLVRLPLPGATAAAFRAGKNTTPETVRGVMSWREWVARHARPRAA